MSYTEKETSEQRLSLANDKQMIMTPSEDKCRTMWYKCFKHEQDQTSFSETYLSR